MAQLIRSIKKFSTRKLDNTSPTVLHSDGLKPISEENPEERVKESPTTRSSSQTTSQLKSSAKVIVKEKKVKDDISKEKKVKEKKDKTSNPEKVRKTNTVKNSIKKKSAEP